jgi:hypothetical protein
MVTTGPSSRDALSFVPGVAERLGYYVYALRDPRDQRIFYIGKGRGERVYQHTRHAKKVDLQATGAQLKLSKIREIHRAGLEVGVDIIRHGLSSEEAAYEVEAAVMDALRLAGVKLSNVAGGHHDAHRGWQPLEELIAGYVAKPVDIREPVVLIRVTRRYHAVKTPEDLYEATREWWAMSPKRHNPKWAFSVFRGIVRAVYRIDE